MGLLTGKRILVTGGSSGIGASIVLAATSEGAEVVFSFSKNIDSAKKILMQSKADEGSATFKKTDMSSLNDLESLLDFSMNELGGLDVLVNNAGTLTRHSDLLQINMDDYDLVQAVNARAPFFLTQKTAAIMKEQGCGGCIINISSISSHVISRGLAHYEASKAALNALTRSTAAELASSNIRVNAIEPGLIPTNINRQQWQHDTALWESRASIIPLGRTGKTMDISALAIYLMSDQASWITGAIIPVDGGLGCRFL